MALRVVFLQIGCLLLISEFFFNTYHFLVVGSAAMIVGLLVRHGLVQHVEARLLFMLLSVVFFALVSRVEQKRLLG